VKSGKDARKLATRPFCVSRPKAEVFGEIVEEAQKGMGGFDGFLVRLQESGAIAAPAHVRLKRGGYPGAEIGG
jgi:hypothetical protein